MSVSRLRDLVNVSGGGTPRRSNPNYYAGAIPWVTPKDMMGGTIGDSSVRLTQAGVDNSPAKLVEPGSVLVVVRSGVLKHTLPVAITSSAVTVNQDMKSLTPRANVHGPYLARFIKAMEPRVLTAVRATTVDNFPIDVLLDLPLDLPPLDEQRRIAAILDEADALRAKRRQALAHLDDLTQSIFLDMFGDFANLPTALLGDVADVSSGITKGRRLNGQPARPVPYLAVSNVQAGQLKLDAVKQIDATDTEIDRFKLQAGDLVLTEGGDPDKLGRGTLWNAELPLCLHQNHIFRVRLGASAEVIPAYLSAFMASRSARAYFLRSAKQTTGIASINMTQLKALPVSIPLLAQQRRFLDRAKRARRHADTARAQAMGLDTLFASLQSRAFFGKL